MEVSNQLHDPGGFTPRERAPGTQWIGGWVGPRAGLDTVVKSNIPSPCWDSNPRSSSPQPSATLLSYPGSNISVTAFQNCDWCLIPNLYAVKWHDCETVTYISREMLFIIIIIMMKRVGSASVPVGKRSRCRRHVHIFFGSSESLLSKSLYPSGWFHILSAFCAYVLLVITSQVILFSLSRQY
jgi:hypothetical protein